VKAEARALGEGCGGARCLHGGAEKREICICPVTPNSCNAYHVPVTPVPPNSLNSRNSRVHDSLTATGGGAGFNAFASSNPPSTRALFSRYARGPS